MPDGGLPRSWTLLGRLLPASIRTTVFEPALWDLLREDLLGRRPGRRFRRVRTTADLAGFFARSVVYALPRYVYDRGRWTRLSRLAGYGLAVAVTVAAVLLMPWLATLANVLAS